MFVYHTPLAHNVPLLDMLSTGCSLYASMVIKLFSYATYVTILEHISKL